MSPAAVVQLNMVNKECMPQSGWLLAFAVNVLGCGTFEVPIRVPAIKSGYRDRNCEDCLRLAILMQLQQNNKTTEFEKSSTCTGRR